MITQRIESHIIEVCMNPPENKGMSPADIEQAAGRMGLEKAARQFPGALHRAAGRVGDIAPMLPGGWTPTTHPAHTFIAPREPV